MLSKEHDTVGEQRGRQTNSKVPKGRTGIQATAKDALTETVDAFEITSKGEREGQWSEAREAFAKQMHWPMSSPQAGLKLAWLVALVWLEINH